MQQQETTGVLLLNLGGPESLDEVEPFLYNLFSDRQIIRLGPAFLQKIIARLIARRRAPKSRENYHKIGGGSPINRITAEQAKALEKKLRPDGRFMVKVCMRYHPPLARQVLRQMAAAGVRRIIGLPLYPHYSIATTGSSFSDLHRAAGTIEPAPAIVEIRSWPRDPLYINCLAGRVREGLDRFNGGPVQVVYSAHSLPKKFIAEGDPYVRELKTTIQALEKKTGRPGRLCYQSRSGPVEWLEPSTPDMLRQLADQGCKNILMIPISFVSDHIETLYEIDMLYRDMAHKMGIRLESTRALNDDPEFIAALHDLVINAVSPSSAGVPPNNK